MEHLTTAWSHYADFLSAFSSYTPFGISVVDLINALLAGVFIRRTLNYRYSWFFAFVLTCVFTFGGGVVNSLLLGTVSTPLTAAGMVPATIIGYYIIFHSPLDIGFRVVSDAHLAPVITMIRGVLFAFNVATFSIERGVNMSVAGVWRESNPPAPSSVWGFLALGICGACGGAFIAEFVNVMRIPGLAFRNPVRGASPGVILAFLVSGLYTLVLRESHVNLIPEAWRSESFKPMDKANAVAVLSIITTILLHMDAGALSERVHAALELIPGWHSIIRGNDHATVTLAATAEPTLFGYDCSPYIHAPAHVAAATTTHASAAPPAAASEDGDDEGLDAGSRKKAAVSKKAPRARSGTRAAAAK